MSYGVLMASGGGKRFLYCWGSCWVGHSCFRPGSWEQHKLDSIAYLKKKEKNKVHGFGEGWEVNMRGVKWCRGWICSKLYEMIEELVKCFWEMIFIMG